MAKKDEHINIDYIQALATTKVKPIKMEEEMKKSFISYAMAVNVSRAIPDVRDGLKPVHRRILYAMGELNLYNDKPYRKCARIDRNRRIVSCASCRIRSLASALRGS